eukprot:1161022-Pelagomonas_calceolata.AAC.4
MEFGTLAPAQDALAALIVPERMYMHVHIHMCKKVSEMLLTEISARLKPQLNQRTHTYLPGSTTCIVSPCKLGTTPLLAHHCLQVTQLMSNDGSSSTMECSREEQKQREGTCFGSKSPYILLSLRVSD